MIDPQTMINLIGGVVLAGIGWFARQVWEAVKELRADLHELEVNLPSHYVKRVDYAADLAEIKALLQKIFDRLDQKVDKS
jgi:hypothetical protein